MRARWQWREMTAQKKKRTPTGKDTMMMMKKKKMAWIEAAEMAVMAASRGSTSCVERVRRTRAAAAEEEEACAKSEMKVRTRHVRASRSRTGREQVSVRRSCFADSGRRTTSCGGSRRSAPELVVASPQRWSGEKDERRCCSSVRGSETNALLRARAACIVQSVVDHPKTTTSAAPSSRPCPWS